MQSTLKIKVKTSRYVLRTYRRCMSRLGLLHHLILM